MATKLNWNTLNEAEKMAALSRSAGEKKDITDYVKAIVKEVREEGDKAVAKYATQFDNYTGPLAPLPLASLKQAADDLPPALRAALEQAIANITAFHAAQKPAPLKVETMTGVQCEMVWRPIEKVGLYVPAGTAPLFSAVLMLAIPAALAGCKRRILCTPPRKDGTIDPSSRPAPSRFFLKLRIHHVKMHS
ncbi:MAG: histidinol dehydrogenase [Bdellovibrionales bacterium]|jgi:histidinol dehydrogenase